MIATKTRRHAGMALATALLLLVTACGGGDDPAPTGEPPEESGEQPSSAAEESSGHDEGQTAAECPEGAPLPDDTDQHGALAVDAGAVDLQAGDQFFDPTCLTGVSQGTVTLSIENTGQSLHNVKIEDQGIDEDIEPGETVAIDVEVGAKPVAFTCKYHTTLGMHGAIVPKR